MSQARDGLVDALFEVLTNVDEKHLKALIAAAEAYKTANRNARVRRIPFINDILTCIEEAGSYTNASQS